MPTLFASVFRPLSTIKAGLAGSLAILAVLFAATDITYVYQAHQTLQASRRLGETVSVGVDLFLAVRGLGYERGRTNVVLNHSGPREEMAGNRAFVLDQRQEGSQALERALTALAQRGVDAENQETLRILEEARGEMSALRAKADAQMDLEAGQRDPAFAKVWFAAASRQITHIRRLLEEISAEISAADGLGALVSQLMLTSIGLRDEAAPEMSMLTAAMRSGRPLGEDVHLRIVGSRGKVAQLWAMMRVASDALDSPRVKDMVEAFRRLYFERYLPVGDRVLAEAVRGGPYSLSQQDFLAGSVAVLESLAQVMEAVAEAGVLRAKEVQAQAGERFLLHLCLLAAGVLVVLTLVFTVVRRLITPLTRLASAIQDIARRELGREVPYRQRGDEVGAVARAVEVLKGNTATMIADMAALEESRRHLQQALDEVQVLSGLLPICANCKKVRDDSGYWQAIEKFIGQRSQARFSHSICPDCVRKLYPEYAEEVLRAEAHPKKDD